MRRVVAVTVGLEVLGLALVASTRPWAGFHGSPWRLAFSFALLALVPVVGVRIRVSHTSSAFGLGEAACLGALAVLDWRLVALLAPVAIALVMLSPGSRSPLQRVHTVANTALSVLLGGLAGTAAARAFGVSSLHAHPTAGVFVGLAVAGVVCTVVQAVSVGTVMRAAVGTSLAAYLRQNNGVRTLVALSNIGLALGTLLLVRLDGRPDVAVVPLVGIGLVIIYRNYVQIREDRDSWRTVQGAASDLAVLEEDAFLRAAARRTRMLFGPTAAELVIQAEDEQEPRRYRIASGDEEEVRVTAGADPPGSEDTFTLTSDLPGPEGSLGQVRLSFAGRTSLNERERLAFDTFLKTVGVGLVNARLHAQALRMAAETAWAAEHDALTGLANRSLLCSSLARQIAANHHGQSPVGVIVLNIGHFKQVNNALGHTSGDRLLQLLAQRLTAGTRPGDTVCRLVGNTFAIVATGLPDEEAAARVAANVLDRLSEEIHIDGLRIMLEGRAGVACWPRDGQDAETLLARAEQALSSSHSSVRSVATYDPARDISSVTQLSLAAELRDAIARHEVTVFFQPQVNAVSGEVEAMEALARWEHPTRGLLGPDAFIPVLEQSGLIGPFTLEVLDQALGVLARLNQAGPHRAVSVNLSARNLLDLELPAQVGAALARHGVPASRLILEITETVMVMRGLEAVEQVLRGLNDIGVAVAVDDFGTGYSSLSFLLEAKVAELKIDRSFVSGLLTSEQAATLVRATIELAHGLGARVVAEGVETADQAAALVRLGCDRLQGYHYSRAVPESQLADLLRVLSPAAPTLADVIRMPFRR